MHTAAPPGSICVATGCATVEEFIASFNRYCDKASFFVATANTRPVGSEVVFQVQLRDGERMLRGLGPVLEVWTTNESPYGRPGVRIGIKKLTPQSAEMFSKLRAARAANGDATLTGIIAAKPAEPPVPAVDLVATIEMPVIEPATAAEPAPVPVPVPVPEAVPEPVPAPVAEAKSAPVVIKPVSGPVPAARKIMPRRNEPATALSAPAPGVHIVASPAAPLPAIPTPVTPVTAIPAAPSRSSGSTHPPINTASNNAIPIPIPIASHKTMRLPSILVPPSITTPDAQRTRTRTQTQPIPLPVPSTPRTQSGPLRKMSTIAPWTPPTGPLPLITSISDGTPEPVPAPPPPVIARTKTQPRTRSGRTTKATEPIIGERTPGSNYVLPANPLTDLSDATIGAFIEGASFLTEGTGPIQARPVATTVTSTTVMVTTVASTTTGQPQTATSSVEASSGVVVDTGALSPSEEHAARSTTSAATELMSLRTTRSRWRIVAAAAAMIVMGGIVISPDSVVAGAALRETAPLAPLPIPVPIAVPTPAPTATAAATAAASTRETSDAPESGTCQVAVKSDPDGANVHIDGRLTGQTPLSLFTSCRKHRVTVSMSRFQSETRWVRPSKRNPSELSLELNRRTHMLLISTQPGAALVYVDGRPAGVSPTSVRVPGYQSINVKLVKPGYAVVSRKLTIRKERYKLSARLLKQ